MKARDLLSALSTNVFDNEYEGLYSTSRSNLFAITTARIDSEGNLVFYIENKKAPLSIKDFYLILMKNKSRSLKIWSGSQSLDIFGFKMDGNKIVV
nr:MAG TPA: hypothetical protein [Caudoviricetes sp.]